MRNILIILIILACSAFIGFVAGSIYYDNDVADEPETIEEVRTCAIKIVEHDLKLTPLGNICTARGTWITCYISVKDDPARPIRIIARGTDPSGCYISTNL